MGQDNVSGFPVVKDENGRAFVELPGGIRVPVDGLKPQQPSFGNAFAEQAYKILNPEVVGGAAGFLAPETGGLSMAIPPLVGAATSMGRDLYAGERDPRTLASHAFVHAGTNMIPGVVGRGVKGAMSMGRAGAGAAMDMAGMIPKVGTAMKGLKALFGGGGAAPAAATAVSDLEGATLPFGEKVLSPEGLDWLMSESKALASKGKAFGDPQFDALEQMISRVRAHLDDAGNTGLGLAQRAMVPLETAAQRTATKATKAGRTTANTLRGLLGLGSTTYEEAK